jgi:hypothetical protein
MKLAITTSEGGRWFKPGETITVDSEWFLDEDADAIEIRLFWYTSGTGTRDVGLVQARRVEAPERIGSRSFQVRVPRGPYSFSGKLITLQWAVEAVVLPSGDTERFDLTIGPQPVEVDLTQPTP